MIQLQIQFSELVPIGNTNSELDKWPSDRPLGSSFAACFYCRRILFAADFTRLSNLLKKDVEKDRFKNKFNGAALEIPESGVCVCV